LWGADVAQSRTLAQHEAGETAGLDDAGLRRALEESRGQA
jgi:hypothetical protein